MSTARTTQAGPLALLAAALVLLSAAAGWFGIEASRLRAGEPEGNVAFVDTDATQQVTDQVSAAVQAVFSYNYANLDRTRRAADRYLIGEARKKYEGFFEKASAKVTERRLVRTATVRSVGVRVLHENSATVLVFLDQQSLVTRDNGQSALTTYLAVTAKQVGDTWKITGF